MIEYKGASYREDSDNWIRDLIQEVKATIFIDEKKLEKITELVRSKIEGNLHNATTYFGQPVAPLAPLTVRLKGHSRPFLDTGELFESINSRRVSVLEREVYVAKGRSYIAMFLQYGTKRMPDRPFFGVGDETMKEIETIIKEN